jgi:hypothetical protein
VKEVMAGIEQKLAVLNNVFTLEAPELIFEVSGTSTKLVPQRIHVVDSSIYV